METKLQLHLLQQLTKHDNLSPPISDKQVSSQWKGRTVSSNNKVCSEIKKLLKHEDTKKLSDVQLFERVCTVCNVDYEQQQKLKKICTTSPNDGATELSKIIISSAILEKESTTLSADGLYQKLDDWVLEGNDNENRKEAAERIRTAYKKKTTSLKLNKLNLKSLPSVVNNLPTLEELSISHNQLTALPDTLSLLPNLKILRLGNNQLTTLPNNISKLIHLEELDLKANLLQSLPDVFNNLSHLENIYLDKNPLDHFPETLFKLNQPVAVFINDTQILNSILTPSLKLKIHQNNWQIRQDSLQKNGEATGPIFDRTRAAFNVDSLNSKIINNDPNDYQTTQQISQNESLGKHVKTSLSKPYTQKKAIVVNQENLKKRLSPCKFDKMRFLPSGDESMPVNIFGSASPTYPIKEHPNFKSKQKEYLHNLSFVLGEANTMITLMARNGFNQTSDFVRSCAGNETHQPTKVLSMSISDFCPPRFEHYLTLAKEMNTPTSTNKAKGIYICCDAGEGRTGTILAATQVIDRFKKLDNDSKKQLMNKSRDYTPDIFGGTFTYLDDNFKTTSFVGKTVQQLRQIEKETTTKQVGISVETPAQFETLEILQNLLSASEKLKDSPPISDDDIINNFDQNKFSPDILEEFFQYNYQRPESRRKIIIDAVKQLHSALL